MYVHSCVTCQVYTRQYTPCVSAIGRNVMLSNQGKDPHMRDDYTHFFQSRAYFVKIGLLRKKQKAFKSQHLKNI